MRSYPVDWYHQVPQNVKEILALLHNHGFIAYIVGGAVRDLWMGIQPHDFDLVSNASPEQIQALFPKTLDIGKTFGIIVVVTEAGNVEIARFRTDGSYTDGRHPNEVKFSNPEEDARRRDFTVNALFYDASKGQVLDYVGGVEDLQARILRTVGDPAQRFEEDALRMLRAVRFYCKLAPDNFQMDAALLPAIEHLAKRLRLVSRERITQEMEQILVSSVPLEGLRLLAECGLWPEIFHAPAPDLINTNQYFFRYSTNIALKNCLQVAQNDPEYEARQPQSNANIPEARGISHLAVNTKQTNLAQKPANSYPLYFSLAAIKKETPAFEPEKALLLSKDNRQNIHRVLVLSQELETYSSLSIAEKKTLSSNPLLLEAWALTTTADSQILADHASWEKRSTLNPAPLLTGKDLIEQGFPAGPQMKVLLEKVREAQLEEKIQSKAEALALLAIHK